MRRAGSAAHCGTMIRGQGIPLKIDTMENPVIETEPLARTGFLLLIRSSLTPRTLVALAALAAMLVMAPFGVALGVHHQLAAADHDGHQHSDFDLCQWVQHHLTTSFTLLAFEVVDRWPRPLDRPDLSSVLLPRDVTVPLASPRGPPLS